MNKQPKTEFYYSLIYSNQDLRTAFYLLNEYSTHVWRIVWQCKEPSVCQQKLLWYREDLVASSAAHPLHSKLNILLQDYNLPKKLLLGFIDGLLYQLHQQRIANLKELYLHAHQTTSLIQMSYAYLCKTNCKASLTFAREIGVVLRIIDLIQNLHAEIRSGYCYIPDELLTTFSVDINDLMHSKQTEALSNCLNFLSQQAKQIYQKAFANFTNEYTKDLSPLIIHAELRLILLNKMSKDNFLVLEKNYETLAISKFWRSLRVAASLKTRLSKV